MKVILGSKLGNIGGVALLCMILQGCSDRTKIETLIGRSVVESRVESGAKFRREYYVYAKNDDDSDKLFEFICSKISAEFSDISIYNIGSLKFEVNNIGYSPDISKWFKSDYAVDIVRHYSLSSKDQMSVINVYETKKYVCVMVATGS